MSEELIKYKNNIDKTLFFLEKMESIDVNISNKTTKKVLKDLYKIMQIENKPNEKHI